MKASTGTFARKIDWSASDRSMRGAILKFVHGVRGRRNSAVTLRQIQKWFCGTPPEFVAKRVDELVEKHYLVMLRTGTNRKRCGYMYDITNMGLHSMLGWTVWDTDKGREVYDGPRD